MTRKSHCSRDATAPELCQPPRHSKNRRRPKREAKRRKAHANHVPRNISKRRRLLMYRRQVYAVCATHLLRGCAPYGARSPSGASTAALAGTPITAQLQAMLPGTWTARDPERACPGLDPGWIPVFRKDHAQLKKPAGVTRPILSQSSDSTSRLGRNTEGNDAQSRPGAGCKPARRHRTRSASESALAKASLDERDDLSVPDLVTNVKQRPLICKAPRRHYVQAHERCSNRHAIIGQERVSYRTQEMASHAIIARRKSVIVPRRWLRSHRQLLCCSCVTASNNTVT